MKQTRFSFKKTCKENQRIKRWKIVNTQKIELLWSMVRCKTRLNDTGKKHRQRIVNLRIHQLFVFRDPCNRQSIESQWPRTTTVDQSEKVMKSSWLEFYRDFYSYWMAFTFQLIHTLEEFVQNFFHVVWHDWIIEQ